MSMKTLTGLAAAATNLRAYRAGVLDVVRRIVPFDAAIYHALSPLVPLETGVVVGIEPDVLAASVRSWDEFGSLFGAMRERAHREGVATDEVLPRKARRAFHEQVGKRFGQRSVCICHLVVRGQFVAAVVLFSRRDRAFTPTQQDALQSVLPAISVGDALHQHLDRVPRALRPTRLACTDQRLTPRQRQVVEHVALGHTNAQIATAFELTVHAVRNHLARIFERLGAANRADVVRLAVLVPANASARAARR